jgi:hypothetical protein
MAEARTKPSDSAIERVKKKVRKPGGGPYAKVLVYGRNGSGKTRFCATAPRVLVAEIESETEGDRSIKESPNTRAIDITSWQQLGDLYWWLQSGDHPFSSVALDTLSAMQSLALAFVLNEAETLDPTREKAMPDKRTWGRAGQLMRGMILAYKNLPLHVVFTAQERVIRDEDTGEVVEITPDLPQSSRGAALGAAGIVGRLQPKEVRIRGKNGKVRREWRDHLYVSPHETLQTKDRTLRLPGVVNQPTMDKLIEAWNS